MFQPLAQYHHIFGILSSAGFLASLYGLWLQYRTIETRRDSGAAPQGHASNNISLGRTLGSYLGFYANFLLGLSFGNPDPYLGGTRLTALLLLLMTFFAIFRDRKNKPSFTALIFTGILFLMAAATGMLAREIFTAHILLIQLFAAACAIFLMAGYVHQIRILKQTKRVGAVSKRMFQLFTLKETFTLLYAMTMPFSDVWSLYFMQGGMLFFECVILYYIRRFEVRGMVQKQVNESG